jgi:hypothetical protein
LEEPPTRLAKDIALCLSKASLEDGAMISGGVWIGVALVALVSAVAIAIVIRANRSISGFRSDSHRSFTRRDEP